MTYPNVLFRCDVTVLEKYIRMARSRRKGKHCVGQCSCRRIFWRCLEGSVMLLSIFLQDFGGRDRLGIVLGAWRSLKLHPTTPTMQMTLGKSEMNFLSLRLSRPGFRLSFARVPFVIAVMLRIFSAVVKTSERFRVIDFYYFREPMLSWAQAQQTVKLVRGQSFDRFTIATELALKPTYLPHASPKEKICKISKKCAAAMPTSKDSYDPVEHFQKQVDHVAAPPDAQQESYVCDEEVSYYIRLILR